jgi:hypothetical protein
VISADTLPDGNPYTFEQTEDGRSVFTWTPGAADAAQTYTLTLFAAETAGDAPLSASLTVTVPVAAANNAPVFDAVDPILTAPGAPVQIALRATDADGDPVAIALTESTLPEESGAVLIGEGDGVALFSWTPAANLEGVFEVTFNAVDNIPYPAAGVAALTVQIGVGDVEIPSEGESEGTTEPEGDAEGALEGAHSADRNADGRINLSELLRVVQFFNTGGYACDTQSEDGFAPGANAGAQGCAPHASDYATQDWRITLSELLRVIQLYNTGAYHPCAAGEDGFCPGAA